MSYNTCCKTGLSYSPDGPDSGLYVGVYFSLFFIRNAARYSIGSGGLKGTYIKTVVSNFYDHVVHCNKVRKHTLYHHINCV